MGFFTFNKKEKQKQPEQAGQPSSDTVDLPPPPSVEDPESLSDLPSFPELEPQSSMPEDAAPMAPPTPPPLPETMGPPQQAPEPVPEPLPPPPPEDTKPLPESAKEPSPAPLPHPESPPAPKGIMQDGLYLPQDQYVELIEYVTETQTSLKLAISTLNKYKKTHALKHAAYDSFRDAVEDLQRSLLQIDRNLFET